jgi:shikimate kinase
MSPPRSPARVLLIGMMATGKSTVGREIAARTGWPYVDNDDLVLQPRGSQPPAARPRR